MELRFDAILYSKLGNKNSDVGQCSRWPQVPHPCSTGWKTFWSPMKNWQYPLKTAMNVCWTFSGPQKFIFWATFDPWAKGCTSLDYINANQNWWDYLAPTPSVSSPETDYITKILLIN